MVKDYVKLVMVSKEGNHNKEYHMEHHGTKFIVRYGRVGAKFATREYPIYCWQEKYNEKIRKGYRDVTNYCHVNVTENEEFKTIEDANVSKLVSYLLSKARMFVKREYKYSVSQTTKEMIEAVQNDIDLLMTKEMSVERFNDFLMEIYTIIPRKMKCVKDFLAKSEKDFQPILEREQSFLDNMAAQVLATKVTEGASMKDITILENAGLEIRPCTLEEETVIKKYLTKESAPRFKQAFYVKNKRTEAAFNKYCAENAISRKDVHFLYHGSLAENFWSIITKGLTVNPKAKVAGKMFGWGSYFANRARKSLRYTDIGDIHGHSGGSGFLAVYKVAYKNPWDIYHWENKHTELNYQKIRQQGYDAVFAHAGHDLINDEIIVYQDCQSTIRFLVEIK